jgi:hypothetical protein
VSNNIAEDKREAAKGISASVDRLETLFDRLYSDTLGMMRETVKDMRKHIWPVDHTPEELVKSVDRKADEKVEQIRQQVSKELTEMVQRVGKAETKVDSIEVPIFNVQNLPPPYTYIKNGMRPVFTPGSSSGHRRFSFLWALPPEGRASLPCRSLPG